MTQPPGAVEVRSRVSGELFTYARSLTEAAGITDFSVIHEVLPPGRRNATPHRHSKLDELYFVLRGTPTVVEGDEARLLSPGEHVAFRAGGGGKHVIENRTEEAVEMLRISSVIEGDVVHY